MNNQENLGNTLYKALHALYKTHLCCKKCIIYNTFLLALGFGKHVLHETGFDERPTFQQTGVYGFSFSFFTYCIKLLLAQQSFLHLQVESFSFLLQRCSRLQPFSSRRISSCLVYVSTYILHLDRTSFLKFSPPLLISSAGIKAII